MYKVSDLRHQRITKSPIIYKWWFKTDAAMKLISPLVEEIDVMKLKRLMYNQEEYTLLYVGQGKNGHGRLVDYHIIDRSRFHEKGVTNGRLSSLRQTLCALLGHNMSAAKEKVDEFMNAYGVVEYEIVSVDSKAAAEKKAIIDSYPPLNSQNTKSIFTVKHRCILREMKKTVKR